MKLEYKREELEMKKKLGIVLGCVVAAGFLGLGVFHTSASPSEPSLTINEVRDIVKKQYPGKITELEQETEFNRAIYEVEIANDKKEYDLKVDGNSGEILDIKEKPSKNSSTSAKDKKETENKRNKSNDSKENNELNNNNESKKSTHSNEQLNISEKETAISGKEAKKIALDAFEGTVSDFDLDEDDGRLIYEIEIENGEKEAEIEVDAYTGEVIVIDYD